MAQGRPRATTIGGSVRLYDPKRSVDWKATASVIMHQAMAGRGLEEHNFCAVSIVAIWPCPKSEERKRSPTPRRWYNRKGGDADNVAKIVLDAGNGVLWRDDCCVVDLHVLTVLGAQGEDPGVSVHVYPMIEDYEGE